MSLRHPHAPRYKATTMSDESQSPATEPAQTPTGIWEHYCEHPSCSAWGSFGYATGKQASRWYCMEHREDGERLIGWR